VTTPVTAPEVVVCAAPTPFAKEIARRKAEKERRGCNLIETPQADSIEADLRSVVRHHIRKSAKVCVIACASYIGEKEHVAHRVFMR